MAKAEKTMENFYSDIDPSFVEVVTQLHEVLVGKGCHVKLQEAKSGHVVSYTHPANKKVVANFVARRQGPVVRIYGDFVEQYMDFLNTLPDGMAAAIEKAPVCKRLLDATKCNPRCAMGYTFTLKGEQYKKCRYNSFMFSINPANQPHILAFLEHELGKRAA